MVSLKWSIAKTIARNNIILFDILLQALHQILVIYTDKQVFSKLTSIFGIMRTHALKKSIEVWFITSVNQI